MSADIEFLENVKPSCDAVFHDSLKRSVPEDKAVSIWMDKDNQIHWSTNVTNQECLWLLESMKKNII